MWSPTHVQITVLQAKSLVNKRKGGTNNAFVTIQMGKEKFQTSVQEASVNPEWQEECDLTFKQQNSSIILTVFHHNFFGLDEFLGQTVLPLSDFGIYDSPRNRWYQLTGKQGKKEEKPRGELEVRLVFVVRNNSQNNTIYELQERRKSLSGSLLDVASAVGQKLQKLPSRSMSLKLDRLDPRLKLGRLKGRRASNDAKDSDHSRDSGIAGEDLRDEFFEEEIFQDSLRRRSMSLNRLQDHQSWNSNRDLKSPMSDTTDFHEVSLTELPSITESPPKQKRKSLGLSGLRQRSNSSSFLKLSTVIESSMKRTTSVPEGPMDGGRPRSMTPDGRRLSVPAEEWGRWLNRIDSGEQSENSLPLDLKAVPRERKSRLRRLRSNGRRQTIQEVEMTPDILTEPERKMAELLVSSSYTITTPDQMPNNAHIPAEVLLTYEKMNHKELIELVVSQQEALQKQEFRIRDLENYIDNLLVRVMDTTPRILQNPYKIANPAFNR